LRLLRDALHRAATGPDRALDDDIVGESWHSARRVPVAMGALSDGQSADFGEAEG
tara:strand:- start:21557 stop:21721 length:165 start_codon:yes stop_codon:yes gene_type:complete